jgi:esterase/lipase superfamily enzyme
MPQHWMITNRAWDENKNTLTKDQGKTTFWTSEGGPVDDLASWGKPVTGDRFYDQIKLAAREFPDVRSDSHENKQQHVTLFVHGFNNDWKDAARRYASVRQRLFTGTRGLGLVVLFTWPSDGMSTNYLPDRADAERSAGDLVEVLSYLYDYLLDVQVRSDSSRPQPEAPCRAKTSIIAHSMGNYVLQRAAQAVWTRKNQPLLVSLINQLVMVAADVDNDLFKAGEGSDKSDGDALANLCYRMTALYSGHDQVLGLSAGLKHFGKRRLGRSGLDTTCPRPDNVWDVDCSRFFKRAGGVVKDVHSAYFEVPGTLELLRDVLRGVDRKAIERTRKLRP